ILGRAQVDLLVCVRSLATEQRKAQHRIAVLAAKIEPERMLRVGSAPAEATADPQPRIALETFRAIRRDQFHRRWPLPLRPILERVDIDAGLGVEQVFAVGHDRERGHL
ncbi:MAG: hypothetical protein ACK55I_08920, partial [bacterium]